eukprot:TRINITY_DN3022_c0_g3_i1.p1 TRINITY_DN3022_c0_g3~~TRINITY_DN3022_c0_g3_i1.p1  ORF type:complete len:216 (+),score=49.39 TRINITY_DN3022_c0_g3_i1:52-699(+)
MQGVNQQKKNNKNDQKYLYTIDKQLINLIKPKSNKFFFILLFCFTIIYILFIYFLNEILNQNYKVYKHLIFFIEAIIELIWTGMILGISFLEAWIKFKAVLLDKRVGFDVGRTVFCAFQKIEIISIFFIFQLKFYQYFINQIELSIFAKENFVFLLVFLQTFILLPTLDIHALQTIKGFDIKFSKIPHLLYVLFELIKVILLSLNAIQILLSLNN